MNAPQKENKINAKDTTTSTKAGAANAKYAVTFAKDSAGRPKDNVTFTKDGTTIANHTVIFAKDAVSSPTANVIKAKITIIGPKEDITCNNVSVVGFNVTTDSTKVSNIKANGAMRQANGTITLNIVTVKSPVVSKCIVIGTFNQSNGIIKYATEYPKTNNAPVNTNIHKW